MQKILDVYQDHYIESLLSNQSELERLCLFSYRARMGDENTNPELENIKLAVDLYMMNQILTGKVDKQSLDHYKAVFNQMIHVDFMEVIKNPILKLPFEKLEKVMDIETYRNLQKRKVKIEESCKKIGERLKRQDKISQDERDLYVDFLISTIGTRDKNIYSLQEDMVKKIFTEEKEYGYLEAQFIVSFIGQEELKVYGIEGYCHLSDYQLSSNRRCEDTVTGMAADCRMIVRKDFGVDALNRREDLGLFLHTICREVKHIDQNDSISNGTRNEEILSCLMDKVLNQYLSSSQYSYYKNNYYFESGELSAELSGFNHAVQYLKRYGQREQVNVLLEKRSEQIYKQTIKQGRNSDSAKNSLEFKYRELGKIINKDKEILNKYPQLRSIYKENGHRKGIEELLVEKGRFQKNRKKDRSNIYNQMLTLFINQDQLSILNISSMREDEIYACMHGLSILYNEYVSSSSYHLLSVKGLKNKFLKSKDDSGKNLDTQILEIRSRCQKIECVLDPLYEAFGSSYKKKEEYGQDAFIYQKDKIYLRVQSHKMAQESEKDELKEMLNAHVNPSIFPPVRK